MHWSRTVKIFVLFNVLLFVGLFFLLSRSVQAQPGASLYFSPASGTKKVGATFPIAVLVNSGGQSINAAEGEVDFDSNKLEVVSISKSNSIFNIWTTEPAFSNRNGTVNFGGGLPSPGYTGTNGTIIRITFRVKVAGAGSSTEITFASVTILANDGQGTNILSGLGRATFSIGSPALPSPTPIVTEKPATTPTTNKNITAIQVTSPSHPDQSKWYANNNPEFQWTLPADATEVLLVLGKKSTSIPTRSYIPPISNRKLDNVADGVWYFNGRIRTSTSPDLSFSYKFNVDVASPRSFEITRIDQNDPTNPQPQLSLATSDDTSGVNRYEIRLDGGDPTTVSQSLVGKSYALPVQFPGKHSIAVQAIDNAGNTATATGSFEVVSIDIPVIKSSLDKLKTGETFHVSGTAKPGYTVRLYSINKNDRKKALASVINIDNTKTTPQTEAELQKNSIQVAETKSDQEGNWDIAIPSPKSGAYTIYTRAIDDRGAISSPSNTKALSVYKPGIETILNFLNKSWQVALDFAANQWLWILLALLGIFTGMFLIKEAYPALALEFQKIRYISNEYKLHKELGTKTKKTIVELKLLNNDIKKELALLDKIEQHRGLQSDEKYLKEKLEKYLQILKTIR